MNIVSPALLKRWQEDEDEGCVSVGLMTLSDIINARRQRAASKPRLKKVLSTAVRAPKRSLVKVEASRS